MTRPSLSLSLHVPLATAVALVLTAHPLPAEASARETINQLCLAGFSAALSAAGKEPPAGMASYACTCFVDQVSQNVSLADAQASCTRQASSRFKFS
ncbi:hypothetical protein [Cyanobium sp. Morenito 9A2]|uniref:hypothetical protein n=1 Tax=Cyanobium sp. Morenito 9A2 TaxID=2823718 RepID=UPI0020CDB361|nr:hypothetical protein [Cyanobium sp. Morenito 9A2]MCP9849011.1 hypothetical protein [Cyanobium sp. Morenito 9A2]